MTPKNPETHPEKVRDVTGLAMERDAHGRLILTVVTEGGMGKFRLSQAEAKRATAELRKFTLCFPGGGHRATMRIYRPLNRG